MPPLSGKQRKVQLKLKRAIKRGDATGTSSDSQKRTKQARRHAPQARLAADQDHSARNARSLQSQFVKLDKGFLEVTRALAGSIVLRRPIPSDVIVLRHDWFTSELAQQLSVPKRPRWRYQMSKEELDANEQAYFRTWLAQQDAIVDQWQRTSNLLLSSDAADDRGDVDDSMTHPMPRPPTHFERNIEVWRQFWRVTEISQVLLVLLDSRCPPLHLSRSLSAYLAIPTSLPQTDLGQRPKQSLGSKAPRIIFVLTKVDISGPERAASWASFLATNYPGVPIVPVEAYAPKSHLATEQGPIRYEPHLPGTFRERLVHTLRDVHQQLLQPPERVTAPRPGETEEERVQRIDKWTPRVKRVIDWDAVLQAKGKLVGKEVGGAAVPKGQGVDHEAERREVDEADNVGVSDSENDQTGDTYEWKEPDFLTVGVIGQPNVGKSSLLNAIFGTTRVRASRTPGKTKHFQTLFWTSDVRLVDCPGLVMPSFVPMDIQVLSGVLPISRVAAVPFCVHQLACLSPLEQILELTHPSLPISSASTGDRSSKTKAGAPANATSDKRTWRPGQRPPEQSKVESSAPRWTANDIMTAYANKKGWATAKAGRPDIHRAGNAILRLIAEGKIPWAFWPPGTSASSEDGIWLKDGVQHAWDEPEIGDEDSEEEDSEVEELSSEEEEPTKAMIKVASDGEEEEEEEDKPVIQSLGRFEALSIDE